MSTALLRKEEAPRKGQRLARFIGVLDLVDIEREDRPATDTVYSMWMYPDGHYSNSRDRKHIYQFRSEARYSVHIAVDQLKEIKVILRLKIQKFAFQTDIALFVN